MCRHYACPHMTPRVPVAARPPWRGQPGSRAPEAHAGAAAAAAVASSADRYRVLFTISGVATDD